MLVSTDKIAVGGVGGVIQDLGNKKHPDLPVHVILGNSDEVAHESLQKIYTFNQRGS